METKKKHFFLFYALLSPEGSPLGGRIINLMEGPALTANTQPLLVARKTRLRLRGLDVEE